MKKTSFWIILIAAVAVLSAAAALWLHFHHPAAAIANIYLDGECIRSIDFANTAFTPRYIGQSAACSRLDPWP